MNEGLIRDIFKAHAPYWFDVKSASVSVYLVNKVTVDFTCQKVVLDQEKFLKEVLDNFGMQHCVSVPTARVA